MQLGDGEGPCYVSREITGETKRIPGEARRVQRWFYKRIEFLDDGPNGLNGKTSFSQRHAGQTRARVQAERVEWPRLNSQLMDGSWRLTFRID